MASRSHLRLVTDLPVDPTPDTDPAVVTIDCAICEMRESDACDDCMVSYLVGHEAGTPVTLDADEQRAVDLLADAGLVPASRYSPHPDVACS